MFLYENQQGEGLFLDYKAITTTTESKALSSSDRANLRKALSGFANAEGGVIIWGMTTTKV